MNPLHPRYMNSRERLAELCDCLARGLISGLLRSPGSVIDCDSGGTADWGDVEG